MKSTHLNYPESLSPTAPVAMAPVRESALKHAGTVALENVRVPAEVVAKNLVPQDVTEDAKALVKLAAAISLTKNPKTFHIMTNLFNATQSKFISILFLVATLLGEFPINIE